jgi:hypothetical protein
MRLRVPRRNVQSQGVTKLHGVINPNAALACAISTNGYDLAVPIKIFPLTRPWSGAVHRPLSRNCSFGYEVIAIEVILPIHRPFRPEASRVVPREAFRPGRYG